MPPSTKDSAISTAFKAATWTLSATAQIQKSAPEGPFAGGSCIDIQRYIHDLAAWNRLSVAQQEQIIARTKQDDEEFASEDKPETAHIKRASIKEGGESVEILRHSMPYGTVSEHGL